MALWEILCLLIFLEKSWGQEQTYGVQTIQDKYKVDSPAISTAHFEMKGTEDSSKRIIRTRRDLRQKVEEQERAARITIGPRCITAFNQCCTLANQFQTFKIKPLHLGEQN
ncbi:complement C5-like isoform 2-T2 [Thomomys bottae]